MNAIHEPSGDHRGSDTSSDRSVSRLASPPLDGITNSCVFSLSRLERKAILVPSGDHRGVPSRFGPVVKRRGGEDTSAAANQIEERYSLASRSMLQTEYATALPSGERRGSTAPVSS